MQKVPLARTLVIIWRLKKAHHKTENHLKERPSRIISVSLTISICTDYHLHGYFQDIRKQNKKTKQKTKN